MGFRFKKVIKIMPGVKLNISKSGISTSLGGRGATVNLGRNGVRGTVGIPGSGLSYSKQLTSNSTRNSNRSTSQQQYELPMPSDIQLDQGKPLFLDNNGYAFTPQIQTKLKKEYSHIVQNFLIEKESEFNFITNNIENIHSYFSIPDYFSYIPAVDPFPESPPDFDSIFNQVKSKYGFALFQQNQIKNEADTIFEEKYREYHSNKIEWDMLQQQKVDSISRLVQLKRQASNGNIASMENFIQELLVNINAPIQFSGSFEVECAEGIWLDIDLPEIEEIPDEYATITKSGTLSIKKKTAKKLKEDYAQLVSGIALILSSYVFNLLPTVETIVISGYTQRLDRSTGFTKDDYIYSLVVNKQVFNSLNIRHVNPLDTFVHFQPIALVTNSLEWKEIVPYFRS